MLTYLLIIITLYLAGNAYIFIRAKQALKAKSLGVKIFLTVLFWICALSFFGTMLVRNCAYMEDFMRPKIIWKRIGSILRFSYDTTGNFGLDSTCFATGQHMAYLCCILNSLMGHYMFKDSPKTGTGDLLVSVQAIEPILIPMNKDMECLFENLLEEVLEHRSEETEKEINRLAFKLYDLSPAEINYITDFVTQSQQSQ